MRVRCSLWVSRSGTAVGVLLSLGWWLVTSLVGPVSVVVVFVDFEDLSCVGFVDDQDVIEEFASEGADDPFAVGVRSGSLRRACEHV